MSGSDEGVGEVAGSRLRSFLERIEQLEEEIKGLTEGKKEVFAEAKGEGYDVKVLKEILRIRKQDQDERDEHDSLLDLYMQAIDKADRQDNTAKGAVAEAA